MKTNKAIVFNCHFNGLSVIQTLGKMGIQCIAMDTRRSIGTYSKYAKYVKCPNPADNEERFIDFLYSYCEKETFKPVLFPTNDHWAAAVSKHKEKLEEVAIPCVSDWEVVKLLLEKEQFYQLGETNEYSTPKTWTSETIQSIKNNEFPIVAKPEYRRMSSNKDQTDLLKNMDRLRLVKINSKEELQTFVSTEKKYVENLIFQEYISGLSNQMYTVGIYADNNSNILNMFTGRKVRGYPADIGDCIIGESIKIPKEIEELTSRIIKEIGYKGIAEVEFKLDDITNEFRLIEINPRTWSWIGITSTANVNLVQTAYNHLVKTKKPVIQNEQINNIAYVKIFDDLSNVLFKYKKDHPEWSMSFFRWLSSLKKYDKLVIAEFHQNDFMILLISFLSSVKRVFKTIFKK